MTPSPVATTRFRLQPPGGLTGAVDPTPEQRRVIEHRGRRLKVLAGPGTGKSATLVEAVAERIGSRNVRPDQILVLTFSRRASAELTDRITRRLGVTTREPLVRTLHGYAYALLRAQAMRIGEPPPRLLDAGESDQMVRELLVGQREGGRGGWPEAVHGALGSPAFAAELRELMLRTAERGITPGRLADLGRRRRRPEWRAAALFAREYQDVSDLRQGSSGLGAALDQAELTRAALGLLVDDSVLAREQSRLRRIFVDEYQDVDPAQARLVELLGSGADELVVFGDPDQSIYAFRGSDPTAMRDIEVDATVSLTVSHRLSPDLLAATRRVAARLPGVSPHRELVPAEPYGEAAVSPALDRGDLPPAGSVVIRTLPNASREAAFVADELRRAHLLSGVPWSRMAVLVRSPAATLPALRRAFATADVPLTVSRYDAATAGDPVVSMLLTVLHCGQDPAALTGQTALDLLSAPGTGLDAEALRRLRRQLRAAHPDAGPTPDLLADALAGAPLPDELSADVREVLMRFRAMLGAACDGAGDPAAEAVLWHVWQRSGLEDPLVAASLRGGRAGQRADSTLDGVIGLFNDASELAERMPLAGVQAFLDLVDGQRIPADPTAGAVRSADAVAVLSAHAAKGLEWDVVCLVGVCEDRWPVRRVKRSMLGTDEVLDAAAGLPATVVDGSVAMQEERRLFYVAATRARLRLIATSVSDQDTVPSRFLGELAGSDELPAGWPAGIDGADRRALRLTDLVAELRRVVTDPAVPERTAVMAAGQLARLAAAGVTGAHPRDWYGLLERSTELPPVADGAPVTVSPSAVESLTTCGLRGVLERRGARGVASQQQVEGIVVHALVDGLARGVSRADLLTEMQVFLSQQTQLPPWQVARTSRALESMLTAARTWIADLPASRTLAGSEVPLSVTVPPQAPDEAIDPSTPSRTVRLQGRVDRLDRGPDGSLIVVDFKTGATVPSKAAVAENAQLAIYQLAIEWGATRGPGGHQRHPRTLDPPPDASVAEPDEPPDPREHAMSAVLAADFPPVSVPDSGSSGQPGSDSAGGAELVYLRSGTPVVRSQPPLDSSAASAWRTIVRDAAERLASAGSVAQENRGCERCPVRSCCPLQPDGRQVTR